VVYFHGGGWRIGSRLNVQNPLRLLAQLSGAVIFKVEYRLAPEYMYPVGTDDCRAVVKYVHSNAEKFGVDPSKIIVAGDSAGCNIDYLPGYKSWLYGPCRTLSAVNGCAKRNRKGSLFVISKTAYVSAILLKERKGLAYQCNSGNSKYSESSIAAAII
jgi:hypothetical protein